MKTNTNSQKQIIFLPIFVILGLVALQIPFSQILGSTQKFSLFDFFGPTTGKFLGPTLGIISVLLVKILEVVVAGKAFDLTTLIRLLPMSLAALYFGSHSAKKGLIAALCLLAFILHPIGREVWYFSLYWLIPIFASFNKERLSFKALGSTFTAHAVGSVSFLYAFQLPAQVWHNLIPIVFYERMTFAAGIWVSFFLFNFALDKATKFLSATFLKSLVDIRYRPSWKFLRFYS